VLEATSWQCSILEKRRSHCRPESDSNHCFEGVGVNARRWQVPAQRSPRRSRGPTQPRRAATSCPVDHSSSPASPRFGAGIAPVVQGYVPSKRLVTDNRLRHPSSAALRLQRTPHPIGAGRGQVTAASKCAQTRCDRGPLEGCDGDVSRGGESTAGKRCRRPRGTSPPRVMAARGIGRSFIEASSFQDDMSAGRASCVRGWLIFLTYPRPG